MNSRNIATAAERFAKPTQVTDVQVVFPVVLGELMLPADVIPASSVTAAPINPGTGARGSKRGFTTA